MHFFIYLDDALKLPEKLSVVVEHIMHSTVTDLIIAKGDGLSDSDYDDKITFLINTLHS